jgi:hypothetical protein
MFQNPKSNLFGVALSEEAAIEGPIKCLFAVVLIAVLERSLALHAGKIFNDKYFFKSVYVLVNRNL